MSQVAAFGSSSSRPGGAAVSRFSRLVRMDLAARFAKSLKKAGTIKAFDYLAQGDVQWQLKAVA